MCCKKKQPDIAPANDGSTKSKQMTIDPDESARLQIVAKPTFKHQVKELASRSHSSDDSDSERGDSSSSHADVEQVKRENFELASNLRKIHAQRKEKE